MLPRILRANGLTLRGGEIAYLLVCLCVLAALVAFLAFSAIYQLKAERFAKARAAELLARPPKARRPKDWGDILEEKLAYDALFQAPPPQEAKQPVPEPPPELKTIDPTPVPFEDHLAPKPVPMSRTAVPPGDPTTALPADNAVVTAPSPPDPGLMTFAERAYEMVSVDSLEFSDRERFGLHLFIAGACGELTRCRAWTVAEGQDALAPAGPDL